MEENAIVTEQSTTSAPETESAAAAEETTAAPTEETVTEDAAPADESTTSPAEDAPAETQEAEAPAFVLPVKVNHEERELTLEEATRYAQLGIAQEPVIARMKRIATDCGKSLFFLGFGRSLVKTCLANSYGNSTRRNEDNLFSAVLQIGKHLAKLFNSSVIYFSVFISQR